MFGTVQIRIYLTTDISGVAVIASLGSNISAKLSNFC